MWVTLIPPSETQPAVPPQKPNFTDCARCPASHPHAYGGGTSGGGFCCPVPSPDGQHCPKGGDCCLSPIPGTVGCENVPRCGTNPTNKAACPPKQQPRRVPLTRRGPLAAAPSPPGAERCSVPADSPLTASTQAKMMDFVFKMVEETSHNDVLLVLSFPCQPFNESSLVDPTKGWRGCDDYIGWGRILGKLAAQYCDCNIYANFLRIFRLKMQNEWRVSPEE